MKWNKTYFYTIPNKLILIKTVDVISDPEELAKLFERLDKASTAYGMEVSAEKTKLMTNNSSGINTEIKVNGQKLETSHMLQVGQPSTAFLGLRVMNSGS